MNTMSSEIVRKVAHKSTLYGKTADEVVLSMMVYPEIWQTLPIVRIGDMALAAELGINGKKATIRQLFDEHGHYLLSEKVQAAFNKPAAFRNQLEKEYIYLDERGSICFMVFQGKLFKIYPREQKEDAWYAPGESAMEYSGGDSVFIQNGFNLLTQSISNGKTSDAIDVLHAAGNFQQKFGGETVPSESLKKSEIIYNKINPFERIFPYYLLLGFLLIVVLLINIFRLKPLPPFLKWAFFAIILVLFAVHTGGIVLRWYISGRAPWSNGYESVVYVAWAAMLAGILFGRKYPLVIGTASFIAGISLFVAHLSWMNPEITQLLPVH